ncbi:MAG: YfiR family protein [Candidatus Thiodiazotropha sp.]
MTTRQLTHITLILLCCLSFATFAKQQQSEVNLLKAVFIYNFVKFSRWPEEAWNEQDTAIKICSIGDDEMTETLVGLHGRTLRDRLVVIERRHNRSKLSSCHVLYLAKSLQDKALEICKSLHDIPVLTISEISDFSKSGGMIELYRIEGRIKFKINLQITRQAGLDLSSRLLKLAIIVDRQK